MVFLQIKKIRLIIFNEDISKKIGSYSVLKIVKHRKEMYASHYVQVIRVFFLLNLSLFMDREN